MTASKAPAAAGEEVDHAASVMEQRDSELPAVLDAAGNDDVPSTLGASESGEEDNAELRANGQPIESHDSGRDEASETTDISAGSKSQKLPAISIHLPVTAEDGQPQPTPNLATNGGRNHGLEPSIPPRTDSLSLHSRSPSIGSVNTMPKSGSSANFLSSSIVFVTGALETIASSKEARKRRQLADSAQKALNIVKQPDAQLPDPEVLFEPLKLATLTGNVALTTTALDCIGKLISYSYFSAPLSTAPPHGTESDAPLPLIERAIDTIADCFQGEATPAEIQLQIVKSLLAAVLNDKIVVHGAGLLKAVRQTYNIFLLSKSSANQQIAQGTLTQMIGTVFERLRFRIAQKEARLRSSKIPPSDVSIQHSGSNNDSQNSIQSQGDSQSLEDMVGSPSAPATPDPGRKEPQERITLQSFENRKSFDDDRIKDDMPTMVTRAHNAPATPRHPPGLSRKSSIREDQASQDSSNEDEEDEIYIKDAFLVFRAMCKLSIKTLPPEQLLDLKSHGMRSKLLSLHLVHSILNNHMSIFTSPLAVIHSSSGDEPSSFLQATKQYLCLSLSRNGASSVSRVFEVSCEIFWLMLKNMRVMLKVRTLAWHESDWQIPYSMNRKKSKSS